MAFITKILIIIFFVGLFILGIVLLLRKNESQSDTLGISLILIGGFMSVILAFVVINSPTQEEFDDMNYVLFHSSPKTFSSIEINASFYNEYVNEKTIELFKGVAFKITDPEEIKNILYALRTAKKFSLNHPQAVWALKLTLNSNMQKISITVRNTKSKMNGTYFMFIGYGSMRCDKIGEVLEEILLKKSNKQHTEGQQKRAA
jgi:hypothetical protein